MRHTGFIPESFKMNFSRTAGKQVSLTSFIESLISAQQKHTKGTFKGHLTYYVNRCVTAHECIQISHCLFLSKFNLIFFSTIYLLHALFHSHPTPCNYLCSGSGEKKRERSHCLFKDFPLICHFFTHLTSSTNFFKRCNDHSPCSYNVI